MCLYSLCNLVVCCICSITICWSNYGTRIDCSFIVLALLQPSIWLLALKETRILRFWVGVVYLFVLSLLIGVHSLQIWSLFLKCGLSSSFNALSLDWIVWDCKFCRLPSYCLSFFFQTFFFSSIFHFDLPHFISSLRELEKMMKAYSSRLFDWCGWFSPNLKDL
jgi:hypothetical protein